MNLPQEYAILFHYINAACLGMPRLFGLFIAAPFLGGQLFTGQLRLALALSFYLVIHPAIAEPATLPPFGLLFFLLAVKELFLGFCLGWLAGLLFRAVQGAGALIDNQRGADEGGVDPLAGEQTSVSGNLLFMAMVWLFFTSGAFISFLNLVLASYALWPPASLLPAFGPGLPLFFAQSVNNFMAAVLLMAGPIVVACLLADMALGLMNRFASQLNVYILAMPIKSGIASFLLCICFWLLVRLWPGMFTQAENFVPALARVLAP